MIEEIISAMEIKLFEYIELYDELKDDQDTQDDVIDNIFIHMSEIQDCIDIVKSGGVYKGFGSIILGSPIYDEESKKWFESRKDNQEI